MFAIEVGEEIVKIAEFRTAGCEIRSSDKTETKEEEEEDEKGKVLGFGTIQLVNVITEPLILYCIAMFNDGWYNVDLQYIVPQIDRRAELSMPCKYI